MPHLGGGYLLDIVPEGVGGRGQTICPAINGVQEHQQILTLRSAQHRLDGGRRAGRDGRARSRCQKMQGEDCIEILGGTVMEIRRMVACTEERWHVKSKDTERLRPCGRDSPRTADFQWISRVEGPYGFEEP